MIGEFEASSPGLLHRIATEQILATFIGMNGERFPQSKAPIGDVYINTHASAKTLLNWCQRVAKIGKISADDFEFIIPDDTLKSAK